MRVVVGVDWSDQTFSAVKAVSLLYRPTELVLVHAVDVRPYESPIFAPAIAKEAYAEIRQTLLKTGEQLLEQTSREIPSGVASARRLCEIGAPAEVILETAKAAAADLLVVGARGLGQISELMLGSVSHQVLLRAACSTLIIKGAPQSPKRVLLAVEGPDDTERLQAWLCTHPFNNPVELCVLHVLPHPYVSEPGPGIPYAAWMQEMQKDGEELATGIAMALDKAQYTVTHELVKGFPAEAISKAAVGFDLVLVGSHGRRGARRFLLGSVSHSVVHRVPCPILVVR